MATLTHLDDGRLALGKRLGEGAQAVVHAAIRDGREVAVKLGTPGGSLRFEGEVVALQAVHHPHIVQIYGAGEDGDRPWLEMELLRGRTLDQVIAQDGAMDPPYALAVAFELCMGLAALHDRGIVHRDIKPSNVFLVDKTRPGAASGPAGGVVVLADLGVAQLPAGDVDYATITGTSLGTIDYAAPEQAGDAKRVGPAADQFGLGATLYAMLTGKRPMYLYAPREMPQVFGLLPEEARPLIRQACAHSADERYRNIRALAADVAALHTQLVGPPAKPWMDVLDEITPRPWFWSRWWWTVRRWMR